MKLKKDLGLFKKGNRWADPDTEQASTYMRQLYEDVDYGKKIAVRAKADIEDKLSMERIAGIIKDRIEEIYEEQADCNY